jgi:hypothetical protein
MRPYTLQALVVPTLAIFLLPLGCGTESNDPTTYGAVDSGAAGAAGSGGSTANGGTGGTSAEDAGDSSTLDVNPGDAEPPTEDAIVYAHDRDTLYQVDPKDPQLSVTQVGKFDCIGDNGEPSMTDIAVDRDGKLFGVSSKAIFLDMVIDGNTVRCTSGKVMIDEGTVGDTRFFGMTFAPPTPNLGTDETLIGSNTIGDLYIINRSTGALTPVGSFGKVPSNDGRGHDYPSSHVGQDWSLSGDIVFLTNQGSPVGFATLRDCEDPEQAPSGCSGVDTLVEIDVAKLKPTTSGAVPIVTKSVRGQILPNGCDDETCGFGSIYGIAAFNSKVFGFVYKRGENPDPPTGMLISIDNDTGAAQLISTPLSGDGFAGAGVTTLAPVIAPPPK